MLVKEDGPLAGVMGELNAVREEAVVVVVVVVVELARVEEDAEAVDVERLEAAEDVAFVVLDAVVAEVVREVPVTAVFVVAVADATGLAEVEALTALLFAAVRVFGKAFVVAAGVTALLIAGVAEATLAGMAIVYCWGVQRRKLFRNASA